MHSTKLGPFLSYLAVAAATFTAACAVTPDQMARMGDLAVCARLYQERAILGANYTRSPERWDLEVRRRGLLSEREWQLFEERAIAVGISRCAVYASWGTPKSVNRYIGPGGETSQLVYGLGTYVYLRGDTVEAMQGTSR